MMNRTICVLALLCVVMAGCGKSDSIAGSTPKATAEAFVAALQAENYEAIAAGWDYETYARTENPDWDTFGESQRELIIAELQKDQVGEVRALAGMLSGDVTVGEPQVQGSRASVQLTAGAVVLNMSLIQVDDVWKVASVSEQAAMGGG